MHRKTQHRRTAHCLVGLLLYIPRKPHRKCVVQVQALEGLGQENSRLAASNEAIAKHLSGSTSLSVSPMSLAPC